MTDTAMIVFKRHVQLGRDAWETLAEICPEPYHDIAPTTPPAIVIRQHRETKELRVDIYDCEDGLDVTYTNGGVDEADKKERRQVWFRDVRTCRTSLRALRVRFMSRGHADNLRLRS